MSMQIHIPRLHSSLFGPDTDHSKVLSLSLARHTLSLAHANTNPDDRDEQI